MFVMQAAGSVTIGSSSLKAVWILSCGPGLRKRTEAGTLWKNCPRENGESAPRGGRASQLSKEAEADLNLRTAVPI